MLVSVVGTAIAWLSLSMSIARAAEKPHGVYEPVRLHWLDGRAPSFSTGVTWGVPWPRGRHRADATFTLRSATGESVPVQSWPLAYWPDGSLKWTAHAVNATTGLGNELLLAPGRPARPTPIVSVTESTDAIEVDTGVIRCQIARRGTTIIRSLRRLQLEVVRDGRLIARRQDAPDLGERGVIQMQEFEGEIEKAIVEQGGAVRAVVKLEGRHVGAGGRRWLPFILRLYFYAGADSARVVHTFIFDGDEQQDFICGLGLRFHVPLSDDPFNRHVRFVGDEKGLWAEGVRNLTGLRRDSGRTARENQIAGRTVPPAAILEPVRSHLELIPAFGDFTLFQPTADSFEIRKRTRRGFTWLTAGNGCRAAGVGYVGGVSGGVAFGVRDFWQRYPGQLDVRGATGERAEVTLWLWAPDAPAMDMRFYHDGLGQDTYEKQLEGLEITYEDYEPGFAVPMGVARTSEMALWALESTPSRERLVDMADAVRAPAMIACRPEYYQSIGLFGGLWSLPDRRTPLGRLIEERLDWAIDYYRKQIDERRWYGFWHYGDVMHSYDYDRHVWRYDVGGYAWDNSELSPDLWLWYAYLRSGRADVFRMAEAMTRHTGEVDVHHVGRFAGLGSRHNVIHWGCSAKQVRISNAAYRRFYYYLTADERVGDLLRELVDSDRSFLRLDPLRKIRRHESGSSLRESRVSFGTDFGALAAAWLTEWERTGDRRHRDKLMRSMRSIAAMPHGFFTGDGGYDPDTGAFHAIGDDRIQVSHLSAVFGALEIFAELVQLLEAPEFDKAWLRYCELYNASPEEQARALGQSLPRSVLSLAHSRLTAYAAWRKRDPALAERAWSEFFSRGKRFQERLATTETKRIEGPAVLNPVDEAPGISTNGTAQWCLAAIENLALISDHVPSAAADFERQGIDE